MILDFAIMAEAAYMRGIPNLVSTKKKSFETICDIKRQPRLMILDLGISELWLEWIRGGPQKQSLAEIF